MNPRQSAAIELIEAYQDYQASIALHEASTRYVDTVLGEKNDIFYAATTCEFIQGCTRDRAQKHFEYALINFRSVEPKANPANWLELAWMYRRTYRWEYDKALHAWMETV